MTPLELAARFGTALGLGLLLGFERQRKQKPDQEQFAGARTFALVSLLGATATYLQLSLQLAWALPIAFLGVVGLTLASFIISSQKGDVGATTEVSALLTFAIGALCAAGESGLATAIAVCALLLLSMKAWSVETAQHIETADIEAVLKFSIITVIVLPLLPNQTYGPEPMNVLNPYKVWLMVVLISGLNFASYVLVKVLGQEHGIPVTGILGGLVSSTAVTLGFSQRSRHEPERSSSFALGILVAWTIMFFRVLIAVAVINRRSRAPPGDGHRDHGRGEPALVRVPLHPPGERREGERQVGQQPVRTGRGGEVRSAVRPRHRRGQGRARSTSAAPVSISRAPSLVSPMSTRSPCPWRTSPSQADMVGVAARTILIAIMANTLTKTSMAASVGSPELRNRILPLAALLMASGVGAVFLVG